MELIDVVAANVRRLRKAAGLNQQQLADATEMHKNTIHYIEISKGESLELSTLAALAKALRCEVEDLLRMPAGEQAIGPLLDIYRASPWFAIDKPGEDELEELRASGALTWIGEKGTAESVHHALMAQRASAEPAP